jgi:flagellar motor switch/type III secretory pathway protein FliN
MADGARDDVLGRKAQAAQRAFEARGMSPTKALRRALSRTADVLWSLALVTQDVSLETVDQDGLVAALNPSDLLILLDGPDGAMGVACVDRAVLSAIVEIQTIQQVSQLPVDTDRVLTATDAAMMTPLIDGTLQRLTENLVDHPLQMQVDGYRFGAMLEDARTTGLLLDAPSYQSFKAEMDLALGRRRGWLTFFLPVRKLKRAGDGEAEAAAGPGPHEALFGNVQAKLEAVLGRLVMPLSRAEALQVGDVIPLTPDALDNVEVSAGPGNVVARGRLGQSNGMRAIRLNWPAAASAVPDVSGDEPSGLLSGELDSFDGGMEEPSADLPDLGGGMDFGGDFGGDLGGDFGVDEAAAEPAAEELPDLPALDFESEASNFDLGEFEEPFEAGGELPDIGLDDSFGTAVDIDFEES